MATDTLTRSSICLKGSAQLVQEFFHFGVNNILYQRGIYPADSFRREKKYGLTLLVTSDEKLQEYLKPLLQQVQYWLQKKQLKRLVVVISEVQTKEVLERWQFDIETDADIQADGENSTRQKDEKKIRQEMADVIKQITASVAFLPLLEQRCSFDVLIYTGRDTDTPADWTESGACNVENGQDVQLRSFSTAVHTVHTKDFNVDACASVWPSAGKVFFCQSDPNHGTLIIGVMAYQLINRRQYN
ncbi:Mitotic spindle assembly checkpoint protein MAD2A [Toxocara canis]|uniref:Mitotic spindle assembly checkpoint protein MAD2A n=1 Tax=Toxocara canis TaxID=6265 RepID=A0A0B2UVN4_TOXCA|nr:Mitotic spindle assembly checkpoint protein MAD2A [Toxocara canis]